MNSLDICYIVDILDNLRENCYLLPLQILSLEAHM